MKILKISLFIFLSSIFSINLSAVPEGGFTTLMVQAKDIDKYVDYLKNNVNFENFGSEQAGYCTRTGESYQGQMFIYNAFTSLEKAMALIENYDPTGANFDLAQLRTIKYSTAFKSLKDFEARDGYHRLWRIKLNNWQSFTDMMTKLQKELEEDGHNMMIGVFAPMGGGFAETGMFHLRTITSTAAETGKIIDEYFRGASWAKTWDDAQQYVDEEVEETFEYCETIFTKN
ncbi:MAG: hypothetical protein ACJ0E5_00195 [Gammaproteobacteria bacterium]